MGRKIAPFLIRHRQMVVLLVAAVILLMEIVEHFIILDFGLMSHIRFDAIVYAVMIPIIIWILLTLLETTANEREQVAHEIDLRSAFGQKLGDAPTWDDLIKEIVLYSHQVAPYANVTLYVANPHNMCLEPEAVFSRDGEYIQNPVVPLINDIPPVGSLPQLLLQNVSLTSLNTDPGSQTSPVNGAALPSNRYDLQVTRNGQQIAVIKLEYPKDVLPTAAEISTLRSAAPVIALAIEGSLLQNIAAEQAAASATQRQEIAQNLHDTLAQNISYLRLKLDQISGDNAIREIGVILQELERMRLIADEAYTQVRNTLDALNPIQSEDFLKVLLDQARTISQRAGFQLRTSQSGQVFPLPSTTRQQILYIAREALHNIEKHAQAQNVHMQFLWLETELIIKITDNGVGFNPLDVNMEGHYGLWIMQHRALEIGGSLKITPADGSGTEVTIWVPRYAGLSRPSEPLVTKGNGCE